ncbi:hypothetical protein PVK06_011277 [Gossypium arboreum]|uniref:Uncharacterized protein n=1 Tax=Gossypium arboreum TaxID=29729 RepID=A0ABR0Q8C0_GOSAR|nr:hypothetical protein PVK06_011277 [Gossypium arboreum]
MATYAGVPGRVLGHAKPVGYTDLYHTANSYTRLLDHVKDTDLICNSTPRDTRPCYYSPILYSLIQGKTVVYHSALYPRNTHSAYSVEEKIARHEKDGTVVTREIVVQFNADVADGMPWKFVPTQREAAIYFNKIQFFCFEEQRLLPGEQIDMPVFFHIYPEFEIDARMDGINNLILSYTFFKYGVNAMSLSVCVLSTMEFLSLFVCVGRYEF